MAANQNVTQLTQQTGSAALTSLFYAVTTGSTDTGLPLSVLVNNLGLTGTPTAPTASAGTNTTQIASCAFVQSVLGAYTGVFQTSNTTQSTSTTTGSIITAGGVGIAKDIFCGGTYHGSIITAAGTIDSIPIGSTTPSTGAFTSISTSGLATLSSVSTSAATITGGSINGTTIGASTATSGKFTTIGATGLISPASTVGIAGTTTNDSAPAGSFGEYNTITGGSGSITSGTATNSTSTSLTAGDWDVQVVNSFTAGTGATITTMVSSVSTVSSTQGSFGSANSLPGVSVGSGLGAVSVASPVVRISVATTTTVYAIALAIFSGGTCTNQGFIRARRVR